MKLVLQIIIIYTVLQFLYNDSRKKKTLTKISPYNLS